MNESGDDAKGIKVKSDELVSYIKLEMPAVMAQKVLSMVEVLRRGRIKSLIHIRMLRTFATNEEERNEEHIIWYSKGNNHSIGYPSSDMQVKLTHFVIAGDENGLHDYLQGLSPDFS